MFFCFAVGEYKFGFERKVIPSNRRSSSPFPSFLHPYSMKTLADSMVTDIERGKTNIMQNTTMYLENTLIIHVSIHKSLHCKKFVGFKHEFQVCVSNV